MRENLTHSIEDYLKTIYMLTQDNGLASTTELANRLGVAPASVTGMVQKLALVRPPLLEYHKHQGVKLTPEGEKIALEVIRHHRLLELFLQQSLGYSWDEVHDEADRLEHVISEEMEDRIARLLGEPEQDPHGEPIPSRDLIITVQNAIALSDLRKGQYAFISCVDASDTALLRYLKSVGLVPGAQVTVVDYSSFEENITLQVEGRAELLVVGPRVSRQVRVKRG